MAGWNPTQFITDQAIKLVKLSQTADEVIAIEMVELSLRQAYQQGLNAGRQAGFRDAQQLAKASITQLKKIANGD